MQSCAGVASVRPSSANGPLPSLWRSPPRCAHRAPRRRGSAVPVTPLANPIRAAHRSLSELGEVAVLAVDGTKLVAEAAARHKTAPTATAALGRTLMGCLLMGSFRKDDEAVQVGAAPHMPRRHSCLDDRGNRAGVQGRTFPPRVRALGARAARAPPHVPARPPMLPLLRASSRPAGQLQGRRRARRRVCHRGHKGAEAVETRVATATAAGAAAAVGTPCGRPVASCARAGIRALQSPSGLPPRPQPRPRAGQRQGARRQPQRGPAAAP